MSDESLGNKKTAAAAAAPRGWGVLAGTFWAALAFLGPRIVLAPLAPLVLSLPISGNSQSFVLEALVDILVLGVITMIIQLYNLSFASIGLTRKVKWQHLGMALVALPAYFITSLVVVAVIGQLFPSLDINAQQQTGFTPTAQLPELLLVGVALIVIPPLVEEIVFRGFLMRAYQHRFGAGVAAVVVSLLFASLHAPLVVCIDVFVLSLFLCYLRIKSDSLWPSIFLHALKNFVAFLFLFIISVK